MNGYDAQEMATQGAEGFRNGYQAGHADAVKAGKAAAAQEAVAGFGSIHDRGPLDLALADYEREAIKHGCTNENAMAVDAAARRVWSVLQSAAPVAAAPVDPSKLGAAMKAFDDAGGHAISYAPAWMRKALEAASTPAAPGIDLEPFRDVVARDLANARALCDEARIKECERLLATINSKNDASPKGGITVVTDAMVNAALRVQYARAGSVWTGTEANPDFVDMRHILNAAMQATSAEVGS